MAISVSNQVSDALHLLSTLERIVANTGQSPGAWMADVGYCSNTNLEACEEKGLEAYISTSRQHQGQRLRPSLGRTPRDLDTRGRPDQRGQRAGSLPITGPESGKKKGSER